MSSSATPQGSRALAIREAAIALAVLCAMPAAGYGYPRSDLGPLDEPLEPLVPKVARTEAEQDRVDALGLFAAARAYEQQRDFPLALRYYQRALRRDPQAPGLLRGIVTLAVRLKRHAVAARYASKAKADELEPLVLRDLAGSMVRSGDWQGAARLYEMVFAAGALGRQTALDVRFRMEAGQLYHLLEEHKKGAECFARVLHALGHPKEYELEEEHVKAIVGDATLTYQVMGECLLLADRPELATAAFEKGHAAAPNRALLQFNLARVYARTGKTDPAMAALEQCFRERLATEGMAPFELLAQVLEKTGKGKELIPRLEKLRAADASNIPLGHYLAEKYLQAGQLDKAEVLYRGLAEKTPTPMAFRGLIQILLKAKRLEELVAVLREAVEKTGSLDAFAAEVKEILDDRDLARKLIDLARAGPKAAAPKPGYGVPLAVALVAMANQDYASAAELFDRAIAARPDKAGAIFQRWGMGLLAADRPADAAKVFHRGAEQKVKGVEDPSLYFYLAAALELDGRTDEALAAARKAAAQKPDSARIAGRPAWVLYHARRYEDARKAYAELLDKFDAEHSSLEVREVLREARLILSHICVLKDEFPQAEEWIEQVLDEFPDDRGAMNDLGYLWADQNKHVERALVMTRKAVEAEPENAAYRDSLGWALYRAGRFAEAVCELEKAAAGEVPDPVVLEHLGDAYHKLNRPDKAKDAWRRAVEAFRKDREPDKAKRVEAKLNSGKLT